MSSMDFRLRLCSFLTFLFYGSVIILIVAVMKIIKMNYCFNDTLIRDL